MDHNSETTPSTPVEITNLWVLGARVTWIILGPALLVGLTYAIVIGGNGWLTFLDLAFCVVAGLILLGRWVEQRSGAAMTTKGEPSTPEDLRRYVSTLIPVVSAVWVVANIVGNHVLD